MNPLFYRLTLSILLIASNVTLAENRLDSTLDPTTRRDLIDAHNRWRAAVGVNPLRWADDLATGAQQWADRLATDNACEMKHSRAEERQNTGENLYWASAVRWTNGRVETQRIGGARVVDVWAEERHDFDLATNTCRAGRVCGHYTQVVWHDSLEAGCAMQRCQDQSQVWVCRYRPNGNWIGERPY